MSRPVRRIGRPGVRALIVAWKPGNSGGAKGCREVDEVRPLRTGRRAQYLDGSNARMASSPYDSISTGRRRGASCLRPYTGWKNWFFVNSGQRPTAFSETTGKSCFRSNTDWKAGCGRSARPVWREGGPKPIGPPYPYVGTARHSAVVLIARS